MSAVTVLYPISIELVGYNGKQIALWQKFFVFSLRQKCCGINSIKQSGLLKSASLLGGCIFGGWLAAGGDAFDSFVGYDAE